MAKLRLFVVVLLASITAACNGSSVAGPSEIPPGPTLPQPAPGTQVHVINLPGGNLHVIFDNLTPGAGTEVEKNQMVWYRRVVKGGPPTGKGWISIIALDGDTVVGSSQHQRDPCDRRNGSDFNFGPSNDEINATSGVQITSSITRLYGRIWIRNPDGTWPVCAAAEILQPVNWMCKNCS